MMRKNLSLALLAWAACAGSGGCKGIALNAVANALSSSGGVFAGDDDPELVRDAVPFGLKTYESILAELPEHQGLLRATSSGFAQYAYAFVVLEAERLDETDLPRSRELRQRARRLFLRARDYALKGLEVAHPNFTNKLRTDRDAALAETTPEDAEFLYWAGASWGGALMAAKDDLTLVAELPIAGALVARVLELDDAFGAGAAHEFMISYEGSRSEAMGGSPLRAREHYRRALEISKGKRSSVHLALAEAVSVREQNVREFGSLIDAALAVDPEADPSQRLTNVLSRRRALRLKSHVSDLFLEAPVEEKKP